MGRVPVNVIGGSLGVGKTTALRHLLTQRPPGERWAVLVNEYGEVGIDGALIGEPGEVVVREVAGGCICCSAGLMFRVALVLLLQKVRPDRLLIEPTGLADPGGLFETLDAPGIREAVERRTMFALVDPSRPLSEPAAAWMEAADVVLLSRVDLAAPADVEAVERRAQAAFPPKRHVGRVERGAVAVELLDLVQDRGGAERSPLDLDGLERAEAPLDPGSRRFHRGSLASTLGFVFPADRVFAAGALESLLDRWSAKAGLLRAKAVLHTDRGWLAWDVLPGERSSWPSPYRRDSRIELLVHPECDWDPGDFEAGLARC